MKKVSVLIPVYRVEKFIAAAVQSVLEQTYKDFELLIIDDGSPDRSIEICQRFKDPRIKIIHQANRGLAGARNTGIRHAQGEYLAFLDGDDIWLPEKLEKQITHLDNSPSVGASFSRSAFIDEAQNFLGTYQMPKLKGITALDVLFINPIGNGSAPVIRRTVFEAIKFQGNRHGKAEYFYFDEGLSRAEDLECWLRIVLQTKWQIEGIPEALTLYRVNSDGLSASLHKQLNSWEASIEKTRSYAPEFVARYEKLARAYQLRYLARRAVRLQIGSTAVEMINRALLTHWLILREPRRTMLTLAAAYLLWLLPNSIYRWIEEQALKIIGIAQKYRIQRDKLERVGT